MGRMKRKLSRHEAVLAGSPAAPHDGVYEAPHREWHDTVRQGDERKGEERSTSMSSRPHPAEDASMALRAPLCNFVK